MLVKTAKIFVGFNFTLYICTIKGNKNNEKN